MAKDPIKKADNGTYYFRANLGYNPITGKQIQKYRSGFRTKKEAKEEYSKLVLASTEELTTKKDGVSFQQFIEETYLPWYKTCLLYTSPSPRDRQKSRMPSSA